MSRPRTEITGISFSSGGAQTIGNMGVLTRLYEAGVLASVKAWYGCSAGAFCAFIGALGVTPSWCRECCDHFDLRCTLQIQQTLVLDYLKSWGVSSGVEMTEFLGSFVNTWEPGASTWTFATLARERPGIFLGITATNLSTRKLVMFSVETHPEMLILDAIRASCSIPFVYVPWISKVGEIYCDGAVIEQYPWIHVKDKRGCLVIACDNSQIFGPVTVDAKIETLVDYCMRLALLRMPSKLEKPRYWIAVNNTTVGMLSLDITAQERKDLFEEGVVAASNWLLRTAESHRKSEAQNTSSGFHQSGESESDSRRSRIPWPPQDSSRDSHTQTGLSSRRWSV
jgi:predicted acylesterase/phospholipase RssA